MFILAEYIWLDGITPTKQLRSKTKVIYISDLKNLSFASFPVWSFDGSSTGQATSSDSDTELHPVSFINDPIRGENNYLVLCEVSQNQKMHQSNTRALLRYLLKNGMDKYDPLIGFEQEYTFFSGAKPLGWPATGEPPAQGPYYCGVGSDKVFGREIVEEHLRACMLSGLKIYGINAEVMPGQWEFQIGYRGIAEPDINILAICDQMYFARWLLLRIAEDHNIIVSFANKPVPGDWNGAGCHTNFSVKAMRDPKTGLQVIKKTIELLKSKHKDHIAVYGADLEQRLTGTHETCNIDNFKSGISDRSASIRIPATVAAANCGYFEDRRPGANCDPYLVAARLCNTVCNILPEQNLFINNYTGELID